MATSMTRIEPEEARSLLGEDGNGLLTGLTEAETYRERVSDVLVGSTLAFKLANVDYEATVVFEGMRLQRKFEQPPGIKKYPVKVPGKTRIALQVVNDNFNWNADLLVTVEPPRGQTFPNPLIDHGEGGNDNLNPQTRLYIWEFEVIQWGQVGP